MLTPPFSGGRREGTLDGTSPHQHDTRGLAAVPGSIFCLSWLNKESGEPGPEDATGTEFKPRKD